MGIPPSGRGKHVDQPFGQSTSEMPRCWNSCDDTVSPDLV